MRKIILLFVFQAATTEIFSQQNSIDKSINIDGSKTTIYAKDVPNLVIITSSKDSIHKFIFKSSQGILENLDSGLVNGLFRLSNLELGKVTISVFRQVDTGLLLRNYKTYNVIKKPLTKEQKEVLKLSIKPMINLEGYSSGKVSLNSIKNATKFSINEPYKIISLTVLFGSYNGICSAPIVSKLNSANFDENFVNIWKRLTVGSYINLESIKIADKKGRVYSLDPIDFRVE